MQTEAAVGAVTTGASTDEQNQGAAVGGKAKRARTTWTEQQKREVVAEAIRRGNAAVVADERGIAPNLLYRWKNDPKYMPREGDEVSPPPKAAVPVTDKAARIEQIKAEIQALKMELANLVLDEA